MSSRRKFAIVAATVLTTSLVAADTVHAQRRCRFRGNRVARARHRAPVTCCQNWGWGRNYGYTAGNWGVANNGFAYAPASNGSFWQAPSMHAGFTSNGASTGIGGMSSSADLNGLSARATVNGPGSIDTFGAQANLNSAYAGSTSPGSTNTNSQGNVNVANQTQVTEAPRTEAPSEGWSEARTQTNATTVSDQGLEHTTSRPITADTESIDELKQRIRSLEQEVEDLKEKVNDEIREDSPPVPESN